MASSEQEFASLREWLKKIDACQSWSLNIVRLSFRNEDKVFPNKCEEWISTNSTLWEMLRQVL